MDVSCQTVRYQKGSLSEVMISLSGEVEDLISLPLQNFRPNYVFQRLHKELHDPILSRLVSDQILIKAQGRDLSQRSLFMIIAVKLTQKEYLHVPCVHAAAPWTVTDSDCAICLEDMSMSESETKPIFQLSNCGHVFHGQCLNKWLDRQQNSCPLCRQDVV